MDNQLDSIMTSHNAQVLLKKNGPGMKAEEARNCASTQWRNPRSAYLSTHGTKKSAVKPRNEIKQLHFKFEDYKEATIVTVVT